MFGRLEYSTYACGAFVKEYHYRICGSNIYGHFVGYFGNPNGRHSVSDFRFSRFGTSHEKETKAMNQAVPSKVVSLFAERFAKYQSLLLLAGMTILTAIVPAAAQSDACSSGFVWRMATPNDHVCVFPTTKDLVATDNAEAAKHRAPGNEDKCIEGYVRREANSEDHVCVIPQTRTETLRDNMMEAFRLASASRPTPVASMKTSDIPPPPLKAGCHKLEGSEWHEVPCTSPRVINGHRLIPNLPMSEIQSNPINMWYVIRGHRVDTIFTLPFVFGNVDVAIQSDPTKGSEVDSVYGPNAYSIQNNTNRFVCNAACANGKAFPALPGVKNSASEVGDIGIVQFVLQSNASFGNPDQLCLWQWDAIVFQDVNRQPNGPPDGYGYVKQCIDLGKPVPLTGPSAVAYRHVGVTGFIQCSPPNQNCMLVAITNVYPSLQYVSVTMPDLLGLHGNWTNVSGTIYGLAYGSQANFTNLQTMTTQIGASCVTWNGAASGGQYPKTCPNTGAANLAAYVSVNQNYYDQTQETNDLINGPPQLTCSGDSCVLWYNSSSP
jgi:hypothetical protein